MLAVARGTDRLVHGWAPGRVRLLAGAIIVAGVALIVAAGKAGVTNSRAINLAVPYLEERCREGCLTNVLPQALRDQTWVVTDVGAPFPPREHRSELTITGAVPKVRLAAYDYCERVQRSRAGGFRGPVLYVDARVRSFRAFDPDFDPEVRYQGSVDLSTFVRSNVSGPGMTK